MKLLQMGIALVLLGCHGTPPPCPPCQCPQQVECPPVARIAASEPESLPPDLERPEFEATEPRAIEPPAPVEPVVFPSECRVDSGPPPPSARHKKWRRLAKIHVGQSHLDTVDISPDETLLLVMSNNEGSVRIYDLESRRLLGNYPMYSAGTFDRGEAMFWRGPGSEPRFIFGNEEGITLYDALTGKMVQRLSQTPCWEMRWSDDRTILMANLPRIPAQTSQLAFYEVAGPESLTLSRTYSFDKRMDGWDLACGNRLLAATFYPSDDIRLYDLAQGEQPRPIWTVPAPTYSNSVDISPRGDMLAVGGNRLMLLDMEDPSRRAEFTKYNNNLDTVRFHPDGGAIVTTSYDGQVQVIEPRLEGKPLRRLKLLKHQGTANVYGIAFWANGTRMATVSGDRTVRIWAMRGAK
jgi:WD40 repeat protein